MCVWMLLFELLVFFDVGELFVYIGFGSMVGFDWVVLVVVLM